MARKATGRPFARKAVEILTPEDVEAREVRGEDMRSYYNTLRRRAEQRLRDLKSGGGENLDVYRDYVHRFPTLIEIGKGDSMDRQLLYDATAEVTRFLSLRSSTIGGYNEILRETSETFLGHYGPGTRENLPEMDRRLFGELMRSIKKPQKAAMRAQMAGNTLEAARLSAQARAFYSGWKKAYRDALSKAQRAGMTQDELLKAIEKGTVSIGPRGGLYDTKTQRYIARQWAALGN